MANTGVRAQSAAIADPERFACEPKIDGVRGFVVYTPDRHVETRNRRGVRRDWLRGDGFEGGLRRLGDRLPMLRQVTILDGELSAGRFSTTMAALWQDRRERLELLAGAFDVPLELSPVVEPSNGLVESLTGRHRAARAGLTAVGEGRLFVIGASSRSRV